jgi:hypothetical protein
MTQAAVRATNQMSSEDILWIRFRVVALLRTACEMGTKEQWWMAQMLSFDAQGLLSICEDADRSGTLWPAWLAAWFDLWTERAAVLRDSQPACALAYQDIVRVLVRYVRKECKR